MSPLTGRPTPRPTARPDARTTLLVALGGAAGATARWSVNQVFDDPWSRSTSFPWATLLVNVAGCVAIGVAAMRLRRPGRAWDVAVTGVLGGFTTMSSFAVEATELVDAGRMLAALSYVGLTIAGGLTAVGVAARSTRQREGST